MTFQLNSVPAGDANEATGLSRLLDTYLPLNRKESFFTATVLPAIICADSFKHFGRFLDLLGLGGTLIDISPDNTNIQFFTEYSLAEAIYDDATRERFQNAPRSKERPDVLIFIETPEPVLIVVEAKLYSDFQASDLNRQMKEQEEHIVSYLQNCWHGVRMIHAALLPMRMKLKLGNSVTRPIVTWEDMRGSGPSSDFHFVERDDPEKIAATLVKLVQERIPERFRLDPIRDVQVLCPMNRGSLGVRELNTSLQKALNPARPGQPAVERFGWRFQAGDKVIQTENDYSKDVFNGDVGIVESIDAVEQQVAVRFDERLVKYDFGELDEISLAYAITIHKSQGTEFPAVVIPLATQHYMLLQRNLIYTGITRGKQLLVLIGQKKALGIAVRNDRPQRRYSGLLASLKGNRGTEGSAVGSKTAGQ